MLSRFKIGIPNALFITALVNCVGLGVGNAANFALYCRPKPVVLVMVEVSY